MKSMYAAGAHLGACADGCHLASRSHRARISVLVGAVRTSLTPHNAYSARMPLVRVSVYALTAAISRHARIATLALCFCFLSIPHISFSDCWMCLLRCFGKAKEMDGLSVATGAKCQESSRKQLHIHCETGGLGFIAQHVESIEGLECLVSEDFDCRDENLRVKHMNCNGVTTISVQKP